jgi:hypothetical protein
MRNQIIFTISVIAIFAVIYYVFFSRKKIESNWTPEFRDPKKDMKSMLGKGNYESVAGMGGQGL